LTSGIVGSKTFGVAKQAILISVQVKCTGQIQLANLLKGLDWTYRDCKSFQRSGGRCVVNLGEGGRYYYADFNNSVQQLIDLGAVVVGPAGNDADDACHYSPGAVMDTIVVGASRQDDTALLYSNFGACVDLYAPGEGAATISIGGVPTYFSGTSAATPHVSGLAAIYLERHALATPLEVRNAIILDATSDVILGANPNLFINTVMRF
jgi:subtilisin family serine protease